MRNRGCFALFLSVCLNLPLFVVWFHLSWRGSPGGQCLEDSDGRASFNKWPSPSGVGDENILFPSGI